VLTILLLSTIFALAAILISAYVLTRRNRRHGGIGDDIIRNDYIDKASDAEKRELHDAFYEPYEQVTAWLNGFKAGPMTEEAQAFMYTQLALDEMGYYILEEKEKDV
jgi:hypothetical protein